MILWAWRRATRRGVLREEFAQETAKRSEKKLMIFLAQEAV